MKKRKFPIWIALLLIFLGGVTKPIQAMAAEASEGNVVIRLDLSNYDSFSETIEIRCESNTGTVKDELNPYNHYERTLCLEDGRDYDITLAVIGDELNLIDLSPMQFEVHSSASEIQTFTVAVHDAAGLEAAYNDHEGMSYANTPDIPAKEPETYSSDSGQETGTLTVTGADVTGLKALSYSLQDVEGNIKVYQLKKENGFKAEIQLPYGRYTEQMETVTVEPEDGITVPKGISFYCKYYGNKGGQTIIIDAEHPEKNNFKEMQLWVKSKDREDYKITNLYRFLGNEIMKKDEKANIMGHVSTDTTYGSHQEETEAAADIDHVVNQEANQNQKQSVKLGLLILLAITVSAAGLIVWRKKNER